MPCRPAARRGVLLPPRPRPGRGRRQGAPGGRDPSPPGGHARRRLRPRGSRQRRWHPAPPRDRGRRRAWPGRRRRALPDPHCRRHRGDRSCSTPASTRPASKPWREPSGSFSARGCSRGSTTACCGGRPDDRPTPPRQARAVARTDRRPSCGGSRKPTASQASWSTRARRSTFPSRRSRRSGSSSRSRPRSAGHAGVGPTRSSSGPSGGGSGTRCFSSSSSSS